MNNPIAEQRKLIEQLYLVVKKSCPVDATSAKCRFEYDHGYEDGSLSVGSAFSYVASDEEFFPALDRELRRSVKDLVLQLHANMKAHTGGDWNAFTLFINEDGTVATKFEYPD
ncbi:hypothetical protein L6J37_13125 [Photobacterium sp. WH77]|uniref:DUF600 domain-containing protein n=1 Tax=Photobacterium arenosum TaxID=2774143 RepID=A0ABR9BQV9_9GAMM|nr:MULTISPECIES: hypothetical protein [Photobacterium]MBD8514661.1 hypothetical protein [Photobacterium arenosum]MBV7262647.1 hypothetical protein [Photobacterium sp. WH24]MCG2837775.1 hypothetical protein [Photobacterium sp. WH77]MCG2845391.1 hypothetical protein [Photobacterium sp. WH80]